VERQDNDYLLIAGAVLLGLIWHDRRRLVSPWTVLVAATLLSLTILISWRIFHSPRVKRRRKQAVVPEISGKGLTRIEFENTVVRWLKNSGYSSVIKTGDFERGLDMIASRSGLTVGVQVRQSKRPVGVSAVKEAVAGLKFYGCSKAMIVTDSTYTEPAIKLAESNGILLFDKQLYEAGIKR
jgi:HJR/Mrr/RecB family endonuclease